MGKSKKRILAKGAHSQISTLSRKEAIEIVLNSTSKDEIENYVMVGGEKKTKTDEEIATTVNRGTNAFKNATNFVNTIKSEQASDSLSSKKVTKKK